MKLLSRSGARSAGSSSQRHLGNVRNTAVTPEIPVQLTTTAERAQWFRALQIALKQAQAEGREASRPPASGGILGMQPRMSSRMQDTMSKLLALAGDHAEKIRGYGDDSDEPRARLVRKPSSAKSDTSSPKTPQQEPAMEEGDDASGKATRQHAVSFDAALDREQDASEPRTRGTPSKSLSSSDVTNSSRATDSSSHSLGEVTSDDVSKDVIPDGPVERIQSRNVKQNREPRAEAHLRGDAIQLGRQNDEHKRKVQQSGVSSVRNTLPKPQSPYVPIRQTSTVPKSTAEYFPQTPSEKSPVGAATEAQTVSGSPGSSVASSNRSSVKQKSTNMEINNTIKCINEIRHSLLDPSKRTNLSPTTGNFIDHFVRKTDEEINAITADLHCNLKEDESETWADVDLMQSSETGRITRLEHGPYRLQDTLLNHAKSCLNSGASAQGFTESSNNNNIGRAKSQASGSLCDYRQNAQAISEMTRPISEAAGHVLNEGKVSHVGNGHGAQNTSHVVESQSSVTFTSGTPGHNYEPTTPSITQRYTNQPTYAKSYISQQVRNRDRDVKELQGLHRVSMPQCDSDARGPVQYSGYSTDKNQPVYTNSEVSDRTKRNLAKIDMSDVAKKLERPSSRRSSVELKSGAHGGSPRWVGTGDGYGEQRKNVSSPNHQQGRVNDLQRGKSSQGSRLSANPTKISLMIARDHRDHAEGPSGGNLSTLTRSTRPPLLRNLPPRRR